ncbi:hypothetical protein [Sphaerisporangium fuscum]|uniref:hypothetical protein n=1 Tax=Sphaerisporangium fuscum TaxID=2835868 RepID=UPI001BDC68A6|nr:hypothetical protein [Sphaerisporangium fuscum]
MTEQPPGGTAWQQGPQAFNGPPLPAFPPARPRRGVPAVLLVAVTMLVGLVVGGAGGAAIARSATPPHGPGAPGKIPEGFPNGRQIYLPGVTVDFISEEWLKKVNHWTCAPWTENKPHTGAKSWLNCTPKGDLRYEIDVNIEYDDDTHVRMVSADCYHLGPGTRTCTSLFANLGWEVLHTQPALRKKAQDWGAKHADSDAQLTIGGITLVNRLDPHDIEAVPATP